MDIMTPLSHSFPLAAVFFKPLLDLSVPSHLSRPCHSRLVWDRTVIDYRFLQKAKDQAWIYFVTSPKSNSKLTPTGFNDIAPTPINQSVTSDDLVPPMAPDAPSAASPGPIPTAANHGNTSPTT